MDTALYYTLSTIAQTLAGALAILVAVVLFKLAELSKMIDTAKATLASHSVDPARFWPTLRDEGHEGLIKRIETDLHQELRQNALLRRDSVAAYTAYQDWGRINRRLYVTLGATVAAIGVCFGALPFTPRIACSHALRGQCWSWRSGLASGVLGSTCGSSQRWSDGQRTRWREPGLNGPGRERGGKD